jgi:hypothetical protein
MFSFAAVTCLVLNHTMVAMVVVAPSSFFPNYQMLVAETLAASSFVS